MSPKFVITFLTGSSTVGISGPPLVKNLSDLQKHLEASPNSFVRFENIIVNIAHIRMITEEKE